MRNRNSIDIDDILDILNDSREAKNLLDIILSYYDIYSGQFKKIPDYDAEYMFRRPDGTFIQDTLNKRIRDYRKFDDSE